MESICFKSTLFKISPDEDEETNPFRYGKELAEWLRERFLNLGYDVEEVIPEDWGWCVMCQRKPFDLWIGCGNMEDESFYKIPLAEKSRFIPDVSKIIWTCFVAAEAPFFKKLFKKVDTKSSEEKLQKELEEVLKSEPEIQIVECP
jgi:hypothetical protein